MSGRASRRKGHDFERAMARELREVFGDDVRRGMQFRDGTDAADVVAPCFWIECKRGKRTSPVAALNQATEASNGKGLWPIAICKNDNEPATVTMSLEDFLDLVREWWSTRKSCGGDRMQALVAAILAVVTIASTPDGTPVYAAHFRDAAGGAEHRAEELASTFFFAEQVYGIDAYLLAALAFRESSLNAAAVGAQGEFSILQLHPRSRWGRAAHTLCQGSSCERIAVLEAARLLALGMKECGGEAVAVGFYRTGRCTSGPGAERVLAVRARMLSHAAEVPHD